MIIRDDEFPTMMQHQEEDEVPKLMEIEQRDMTSMPTGKALFLVQYVLYLHHFLQYPIPHNLGFSSKVKTLTMDSISFIYSIYKRYLESPKKCHYGHRVALQKLVIARDDLHQ